MRPGEVLDAQGDLMERLADSRFRTVVDALGQFEFGRAGGTRDNDHVLATMLATGLKAAHTYRVTHDMSMLVEHAANGLDGLDRFDASLAPTGCGFVSFDRPLPILDQRGKTMLVHYVVWGPISLNVGVGAKQTHMPRGTLVTAFNDIWRQPDEVQADLYEKTYAALEADHGPKVARRTIEEHTEYMGRWATVGASAYADEQRLGPALQMPSEEQQAKILAEGDTPHAGTSMIRYIHALWLLMEQTVAKVENEVVDRKAVRRAMKRRLPAAVTVIKLRREASVEGRQPGESLVEWAHRWVVRGHWRWQAVSAHHPLAQEIEPGKYRARIWINPFVKGPDGAPFVQSEKVYSLER